MCESDVQNTINSLPKALRHEKYSEDERWPSQNLNLESHCIVGNGLTPMSPEADSKPQESEQHLPVFGFSLIFLISISTSTHSSTGLVWK